MFEAVAQIWIALTEPQTNDFGTLTLSWLMFASVN